MQPACSWCVFLGYIVVNFGDWGYQIQVLVIFGKSVGSHASLFISNQQWGSNSHKEVEDEMKKAKMFNPD